jgi:hypothetical protein
MRIYTVEESKKFLADREACWAHDATFPFRMPEGFPGMVTRTHPDWIEAVLQDASKPATYYGQAVVADGAAPEGVRVLAAGDSALTQVYGFVVRPFPIQQPTTLNYGAIALGANVAPPPTGAIDVMRMGSMMVTFQGAAQPHKGSAINICIVAGTGYVVGGVSADTVSGTFITLPTPQYSFNGPIGTTGLVEIIKMA